MQVYEAAEDSWLLEECIRRENLRGLKCLDLGCGSGVQTIAILKSGAEKVFSVDINPNALLSTQKKVGSQIGKVKLVQSDLFSSLGNEKFDFIVFNPPYLPSDEIKWKDLDGGKKGIEVITRFLGQFSSHLEEDGVVFLLLSSFNEPDKIIASLKGEKFFVDIIASKKLFFEELSVLRISSKPSIGIAMV